MQIPCYKRTSIIYVKMALKKAKILQHTKRFFVFVLKITTEVDRRSSFSLLDSTGNFSLGTRH